MSGLSVPDVPLAPMAPPASPVITVPEDLTIKPSGFHPPALALVLQLSQLLQALRLLLLGVYLLFCENSKEPNYNH